MAKLAAKHSVHPNMITQWKRKAKDGLPGIFTRKTEKKGASYEVEVKELHAKIGELTVENDFLAKAFGR